MADTTTDQTEELETETSQAGAEATEEADSTEPTVDGDDEDEAPADPKDEIEFWKNKAKKNGNEARNLRSAKKALEAELTPLQQAAKAKAESEMSELEKATARIEELIAKNTGLERTNALGVVAARYDLPERVLGKLEGATPDELLASADAWAADLGIERKDKAPRRTKVPVKDLAGGIDPDTSKTASVADQLAEATKTGDWKRAGALKSQLLFAAAK